MENAPISCGRFESRNRLRTKFIHSSIATRRLPAPIRKHAIATKYALAHINQIYKGHDKKPTKRIEYSVDGFFVVV